MEERDDCIGVRAAWVPFLVLASCSGGNGDAGRGSGSPGAPDPAGPVGSTGPTGADGSAIVERLDASAECDGLVPERVPAPVDVEWTQPSGTCGAATADGTGHVAVSARNGDQVTWQVFAPSGAPAQSLSAWPLVPQPSGWHGLGVVTVDPTVPFLSVIHRTFSPEGGLLGETAATAAPTRNRLDAWTLAQDPRGGSATAVAETDAFHNHWSDVEAQRFDASGRARWGANLRFGASDQHAIAFLGTGISTVGESLTLWQHSAQLDAWWIDGGGNTVASEVRAEDFATAIGSATLQAHDLQLVPLLDGALALRSDGSFRRLYPHLATRSAPLPGWLADRAGWVLRFTRGARGYALLPPAGQPSPDCAQALELRSSSGRLCGRVRLLGGGGACTTGAVDQGWDGTVVQQRAQGGCRYRFWPGLLGG